MSPETHLLAKGDRFILMTPRYEKPPAVHFGGTRPSRQLTQMSGYPGLLLKVTYWHWPRRDLSGNTIEL